MKRIFTIFAVVLLNAVVFAQSPQKMSYQAVIRNSSDVLVTSTTIGMQISILQGSAMGGTIPVYVETQTPTTNINGLVSLEVGAGTVISGTFSNIDWANGPFYIKTETDLVGGTSYSITGTSQLLSVPYALFSANGTPGPQGPAGNEGATGGYPVHTIGESYGGGIVFYVYDNGQHGLIAATSDQSTGIMWYNGTYKNTGSKGDGLGAGSMNTAIIVATQIGDNQTGDFAAKVCADYSVMVDNVYYGDWYLPSQMEIHFLYLQKDVVGGFTSNFYWTSTEQIAPGNYYAWGKDFNAGGLNGANKFFTYYVRAIRAF